MTRLKRGVLILFVILSCVACDQITKVFAKSHLKKNKVLSFAGGSVKLDYNENKGGVFSFEPWVPEKWRGTTVSIVVALFLGILVFCLMFTPNLRLLATLGLSLFGGGSLSNWLDRVVIRGYVVDFLVVGWGGFHSCIFNMADAAITIGLTLFALSVVRHLLVSISGGTGHFRS